MTSRYIYCPLTSKRLCRRVTLMDRIRRRLRRREEPDLYPIGNYNAPVFPK